MKRRFVLSLLFAFVSVCAGQNSQAVDPSKGLVLANDYVRLEFQPGGMGLRAMVDVKSGRNHIEPGQEKATLWEVTLGRGTLNKPATNNYKPCNYARIDTLPGGARRAVMEWNDLRWWLEDKSLTVRVTVDLPPDSGIAQWRIFVENGSDYWGVSQVSFPLVNGFPAPEAYDVARPTFAEGGQLLPKVKDTVRGRHPSGGWPMQFCSLQRGRDSVYLGTRDGEGQAKNFHIEPGKQLYVVHYPEGIGQAGTGWNDCYPVEFGPFQGTWVQAAHHYRDWALKQKWATAGKLSERRVPAKIKDAAFWVCDSWIWKEDPKEKASDITGWVWKEKPKRDAAQVDPHELNKPLLDALQEMGVPTAIHWYNWHETRFDNNYPHYLPAKPGFAERVKELTAKGVLVMPYINGSSADMNIPDWEKFAPSAIVDEADGYRHHLYSEAAGRLLTMCPSQQFWQRTIAGVVESLVSEYGVNGVYVDQISAMEHELCFNKEHGHALGGGHYWVDGHRNTLRKIRNVAERAGRDVTITSEGADEVFLDLVDANLTWAQPTETQIPLMPLVYSGYTVFFGSPCDYQQSDQFFRFAQGQALIDGRQNGWMNLRLFEQKNATKVSYLKACARTRVAYGKYLTYGQLVEPLEPLDPVPSFTEDAFGWNKKHRGTAPLAEGRLWKAEDGSLAVFFANYGDQPIKFRYQVGGKERTETLAPASVKVVEVGK